MEMIFYLVGSTLEIASEPLQIGRKWSSFDYTVQRPREGDKSLLDPLYLSKIDKREGEGGGGWENSNCEPHQIT